MNVRLTPHGQPQRTDLYGGVSRIVSDGIRLTLVVPHAEVSIPLRQVAELALDEEPGDWW